MTSINLRKCNLAINSKSKRNSQLFARAYLNRRFKGRARGWKVCLARIFAVATCVKMDLLEMAKLRW